MKFFKAEFFALLEILSNKRNKKENNKKELLFAG